MAITYYWGDWGTIHTVEIGLGVFTWQGGGYVWLGLNHIMKGNWVGFVGTRVDT